MDTLTIIEVYTQLHSLLFLLHRTVIEVHNDIIEEHITTKLSSNRVKKADK